MFSRTQHCIIITHFSLNIACCNKSSLFAFYELFTIFAKGYKTKYDNMKKRTLFGCIAAMLLSTGAMAQNNNGGIDAQMLQELKESYTPTGTEKALQNIMLANSVKVLSVNQENLNEMDTHFSHSVNSKGITDQKSSGRCWLFTGMNVLRAKMIASENLGAF